MSDIDITSTRLGKKRRLDDTLTHSSCCDSSKTHKMSKEPVELIKGEYPLDSLQSELGDPRKQSEEMFAALNEITRLVLGKGAVYSHNPSALIERIRGLLKPPPLQDTPSAMLLLDANRHPSTYGVVTDPPTKSEVEELTDHCATKNALRVSLLPPKQVVELHAALLPCATTSEAGNARAEDFLALELEIAPLCSSHVKQWTRIQSMIRQLSDTHVESERRLARLSNCVLELQAGRRRIEVLEKYLVKATMHLQAFRSNRKLSLSISEGGTMDTGADTSSAGEETASLGGLGGGSETLVYWRSRFEHSQRLVDKLQDRITFLMTSVKARWPS